MTPIRMVTLFVLACAASTLPAQSLIPVPQQEFNAVAQSTSSLKIHREPVITCTVGRAGFLRNAGRSATVVETTVALGVSSIVLGGTLFALVASFRLPSEKVDSFFACLIPELAGRLRPPQPLAEDFSPFKFEPGAKQEAASFAQGSPPDTSRMSEVSIPALDAPRLHLFSRASPTTRRRFPRLGGWPSLNRRLARSRLPKFRNFPISSYLHRKGSMRVPTQDTAEERKVSAATN